MLSQTCCSVRIKCDGKIWHTIDEYIKSLASGILSHQNNQVVVARPFQSAEPHTLAKSLTITRINQRNTMLKR